MRTAVWVLLVPMVIAACAPLSATRAGSTPAAEATSARRTAVAEVQRIIAGSDEQPTPEPTPTAPPTCAGAIWWHEARRFVGESRLVEGPVVRSRPAPEAVTLLEVGQHFPDPTGLAVFVPSGAASRLAGKTVCVSGRIVLREGSTSMDVSDAGTIRVLD